MNSYIIIGDNGEEYGPVSAEEIRNWIADRRVDAQTLIRLKETQEWKRASEWPEFTPSLTGGPPSSPAMRSFTPEPGTNVFGGIGLAMAQRTSKRLRRLIGFAESNKSKVWKVISPHSTKDVQRLHETFGCTDPAQEPFGRAVREFTMNVQVGSGYRICSFHAPNFTGHRY